MKNNKSIVLVLCLFGLMSTAQVGYNLKINLKGATDTVAYLAKYLFDQTYIADTSKKVKKGVIEFNGKTALDKGVYILVNQDKVPFFEILVNESQNFSIEADVKDIANSITVKGSAENEQFFRHLKFNALKNNEFNAEKLKTLGKSKQDSTKIMHEKIMQLEEDVKKFDADFMEQNKGTFLYDLFNLKTEKTATLIPKASNGRPDSLYPYYYYKNHFFDGVNFKDERLARTPYFDDRVKKYFDNLLINNPDTVINEIDRILALCKDNSLNFNVLMGYLTYKYEQSKIVGFDKVFLHLVDTYILSGRTKGLYSDETVKVLKERSEIMNPLLEGKKVNDLYMIDTVYARQVKKMGFDTTSSSKSVTDLYVKNKEVLAPMFRTLYQVKAKYTILLFWSADCGHCQKEVPKLHQALKELKGKVDVKVYAVQTKDDMFEDWRKFLIENKITDFINVFDPIHINDVKTKFDVTSTPLIYVLDQDKKIIAKKIASEYVGDLIKALEKQNKNQ